MSSQVKIQLQLREEDGVLRSSLHTLSNGSQVLLPSHIYKRYGHFLITKQIRFYEQALYPTRAAIGRVATRICICICCQVTAKLFYIVFPSLGILL